MDNKLHEVNEMIEKFPKTKNELDHTGFIVINSLNTIIDTLSTIFIKPFNLFNESFKAKINKKASKIKKENLKEAQKEIVAPSLFYISYLNDVDSIREMFENLIVSTMDDSLVVYPTFPEIIKQLTPDEAKILKFIYHNNYDKYYPLINIKTVREQSFTYVFKNFTNQFNDLCQFPERISYYIDNLKRLGIINIPFLQLLADNNQYLYLKNSEFFRDLSKKASLKGERIEAEETYFEITKFGKEFLDACVLGKYDGKEE